MPDIGYYTLPVILSFQGIDKQVNDALGKTLDQTVPKTINKSVNDKIGKQIEASTKTVGKKIGTTLNTSINPQQVGKDIGAKINTGITVGVDAKKVGKDVSTKVSQGIDPKVIGKVITEGLTKAQNIDAKKVGKTIGDNMAGGIDTHRVGQVLKDVLREPLNDAKQVAKDWGKQVGEEILSGNVKQAATQVGDLVQNTTTGINNLGHVLGVNLDGLEKFGTDTAKTIDGAGSKIQSVYDKVQDKVQTTVTDVKNVNEAIKGIGEGGIADRIQSVSTALSTISTATGHLGLDISGITTPVQSVVNQAADIAGLVTQVRDLKAGLVGAEGAGALGTLGGVAAAAGPVAVTIVGIAEAAAVGIAAKTAYDIATFKPEPGAPGTSPALAPGATIPTLPGFPSTGLPGLIPPARPTPRGDFVPAAPPPPPPPGRVPATEIPQPGWTKDPKTGTLYTPDGTPVPATPGEYARPAPDYWAPSRPTPAPVLAPPSAPAPAPGPARIPGLAEATAGVAQANIHAGSANVSIGSANVSGISVSVPTPYTGSHETAIPGKKSWFQSGGAVPIIAHTGEHVFTKDDVAAMGGQSSVYAFRAALHAGQGYDDGGEITDLAKKIATPVAEAAAKGAAQGAQAGGAGMARPAILGGPGGQQMGADIATQLLGIGAGGVGETLGLGTLFPDPMQNPNVKSLIALASAFKGPIMGAMKGKLGIQQPGWQPGMPVAAMAGDTGAGASIGLPFGLPSIDLPNAPEGGGAPPGGGTVGGGDTHIDASLNVHGDVGNEKALRDHQQQIQRGLDRLAPMPTGPN
jgi:hypothetical protein